MSMTQEFPAPLEAVAKRRCAQAHTDVFSCGRGHASREVFGHVYSTEHVHVVPQQAQAVRHRKAKRRHDGNDDHDPQL